MSDCSTPTSGLYTLVFSGTNLGDYVHEIIPSEIRLTTDVFVKHNMWSNQVVLDSSYPVPTHEHTFVVSKIGADRHAYMKYYYELVSWFTTATRTLELHNKGAKVVDYGGCFLRGYSQNDPQALLVSAAGLLRLSFIGNTAPIVI